jgi:intracellular multiplication protein IcmP
LADKKPPNTLYENGIGWAILLLIFGILAYIFWYYYASEVRDIIRWIRYGEMWLLSWFLGDDYTILFKGREFNWNEGFKVTPRYHADELTFQHLSYFNALTMQPLKIAFMMICGIGALWCLTAGPHTQYRKSLSLEGLINRQGKNFRIISPFIKFNPTKQKPRPPGSPVPAELPLFAEALGPEEWLAYNSIPTPDGKIDEGATAKAFEKQLGDRWKGPNALKPYQQVLLAAFCLKAARKRADCDDMLGRLALCWGETGLKLGRDRSLLRDARRILRDSNLAGKTLSQCNRHAFITTAMLRALAFARSEGGVLAPAQFVWLRAHDRTLWYPLNNIGRQSYHMEALGAMSHFKTERMTQRPIPVPKMEDAVKVIKEYMASQRARPIPQLDYSGSKKKGIKAAK